jgi:hypothetical protein
MAVFRITFIWAPVLIFIIIILRNKNAKKYLPLSLLMLLVGIYLGKKYALNEISLDQSVYFVLSNKVITSRLDDTTSSFASFILSGYDNWSFSKKLLLLPVTTGIQYITPFDVYNIKYFLDYPYYLISKNYNLIWLILIGPLMLYSIGSIFNYRNRDIPLLSISVLGIVFYVIPAFVFGGAIPRYAVPYFSLLLPLMSLNYIQIQRDRFSQQKWRVFYLYYFLTFCFLLFVYLLFKILK